MKRTVVIKGAQSIEVVFPVYRCTRSTEAVWAAEVYSRTDDNGRVVTITRYKSEDSEVYTFSVAKIMAFTKVPLDYFTASVSCREEFDKALTAAEFFLDAFRET